MDGGGATDFDLSGNDGNYAIVLFSILNIYQYYSCSIDGN